MYWHSYSIDPERTADYVKKLLHLTFEEYISYGRMIEPHLRMTGQYPYPIDCGPVYLLYYCIPDNLFILDDMLKWKKDKDTLLKAVVPYGQCGRELLRPSNAILSERI